MILVYIAITAVVFFFLGRWHYIHRDIFGSQGWHEDESLVEAYRWVMRVPNATPGEICRWASSRENLHLWPIFDLCRKNPKLLKQIKDMQKWEGYRAKWFDGTENDTVHTTPTESRP